MSCAFTYRLSTTTTTVLTALMLLSSDEVWPIQFCPVTSPTGELVYVTKGPANVLTGISLSACGAQCAFSRQISTGTNECRCFNYNASSSNCSLFYDEPTTRDVDKASNTVVYQVAEKPLTGLWSTVSSSSCAFPFFFKGTVSNRCRRVVIKPKYHACANDFYMCFLKNTLTPAFCSNGPNEGNAATTCQALGTGKYYKAADCSFPFSYKGQLYTSCARGVTGVSTDCSPLACTLPNRTFVNCYPPADFTAQDVVLSLTVSTTLLPVTTQLIAGWIVFQQRVPTPSGSAQFNWQRTWAEYKNGFGTVGSNFWLGLEAIHQMTAAAAYRLRIEVQQTGTGQWYSAEYWSFVIGDEASTKYLLKVGGYYGDAGDALQYYGGNNFQFVHNGMMFSTKDNDNTPCQNNKCAESRGGGWWFKCCYWACTTCNDASTGWWTLDAQSNQCIVQASRMMIKLVS